MNPLRLLCGLAALLALAICVIAPLRVLLGSPSGDYAQDFEVFKQWFNGATILWFIAAPYWMAPDLFTKRTSTKDPS